LQSPAAIKTLQSKFKPMYVIKAIN